MLPIRYKLAISPVVDIMHLGEGNFEREPP
jgi:hypothetical protein